MKEDNVEYYGNEDMQANYRSLNCQKARTARTIKKNEKLLKDNEEKAYFEVYSNLKKEKKKQIKLLELATMSKEIEDIKHQLSKYTPVKATEPPPMKQTYNRNFFNN
jgi:glycyl-tRNA synthetase beta subunit